MSTDKTETTEQRHYPDAPANPTDQDRQVLRDRVRAALALKDMSQRAAEEALNLSVGYLSHMFKGETRFTQAILIDLCKITGEEPSVIVRGTPWEYMLHEAPPDDESERVRELAQQLDGLKVRLAEVEAELHGVLQARERDQAARNDAEQAARQAREEANNAVQTADTHRRGLETKDRELQELKAAHARLSATVGVRDRQIAELTVAVTRAEGGAKEARAQADAWRASSQKFENSSIFLQKQVTELEQRFSDLYREHQGLLKTNQNLTQRNDALSTQVRDAPGPGTGAALGFAAGLLIAASSGGGGRRRR